MTKSQSVQNLYIQSTNLLSEIETEMKRIGYWSQEPLQEDAYNFQQAFAMDTMTFAQWLQFILFPRVQQIIKEKGDFPSESMTGVQAMREFDGDEKSTQLVALLNEFDDLFNKRTRKYKVKKSK